MALREIAAEFDIRVNGAEKLEKVNQQLDKSTGMLSGFGDKLREIASLAAGAFAVRELGEFMRGQAELGEELNKTALKTGLGVEQLQRLEYAAGQSGISAESLTGALGKLEMQLGGGLGGKGDSPAIQTLTRLGIKTKDATGKSRDLVDILGEASDAVKNTEDPNKRAAMSMQLFGRSGRELLPFLLKGKEGIHDLMKEADNLGVVLGQDFVQDAQKAAEEQRKLDWSLRSLKATVAQQLFPAFRDFIDKIGVGVRWFQNLAKHTTGVTTALSALGFVAGVKLFSSISKLMGFTKGGGLLGNIFGMAKLGLIIAGIAILYLAWDELFGLFTGKRTVIGDAIDDVYGKGQSTKDVNELKEAWKGVLDALFGAGKATGDWDEIWGAFKSTILTDLAAITHSTMTLITLWMKGVSLMVTLATEAGKLAMGKGFDTSKVTGAFNDVKTAFKSADFSVFGGALMPAVMKDKLAVGYKGRIEVNPNGPSTYGVAGGRIGPPAPKNITIHQTNHIQGGDPDKVKNAIHQGTSNALSQGDLRNAYQATRSATPVQTGNFNPMGNP